MQDNPPFFYEAFRPGHPRHRTAPWFPGRAAARDVDLEIDWSDCGVAPGDPLEDETLYGHGSATR